MTEPMVQAYGLRMSQELSDEIWEQAHRDGTTCSDVMREALSIGLAKMAKRRRKGKK